ncbi:hypothetical protein VE00_05181 [Pseudogymnoascus sp. WSF 3629]|nr:hypothetical protein VE00_05181 [Pseudogymnoascus sp. WSF 3629]
MALADNAGSLIETVVSNDNALGDDEQINADKLTQYEEFSTRIEVHDYHSISTTTFDPLKTYSEIVPFINNPNPQHHHRTIRHCHYDAIFQEGVLKLRLRDQAAPPRTLPPRKDLSNLMTGSRVGLIDDVLAGKNVPW